MTDIELANLVEQYTGLTDRNDPAYAQAYRLAHAVATAAQGDETAHLLASPANAQHLERSLAQLNEASERALILKDGDPGDTPQYRALQAIIDDLIDNAPEESLDNSDTPEGLMLSCLGDAMIRYEKQYWPMDDEPETRKDLPSPAPEDSHG